MSIGPVRHAAGDPFHSAIQDFYFGDVVLLRRHDYNVDVSGGIPAAQLVHDYVQANGLRMPGKRRAYRRKADGQVNKEALLVSIDLSGIHYS